MSESSSSSPPSSPKLYTQLASWFHLLSAPEDYAEESQFIRDVLSGSSVLELGSGGGNNASHLKRDFQLTLVDSAPGMLDLSRKINPECEHLSGDMRSIRLGREFDAVLVHDAVMHLTTQQDLFECMETARRHCRTGGHALFVPDFVRETFRTGVHHGGHDGGQDGDRRSLRYIEWTFDPDPSDTTYTVDFVFLLREGAGAVRVEHDAHIFGLFSRDVWMDLLRTAGFDPRLLKDSYDREVFVGEVR